ncbi:PoNe immunity protein domain-containing protein [Cupriavidus necator]|uniref:PoNe immunity protein domain-containing protein n=1 Tax=Cupriavidus necator TaxID=106590 RepID=UPI00339D6317
MPEAKQEDKESVVPYIKDYLKQWYRYQSGARWYDAHKKIHDDQAFNYGYWAFEAGAKIPKVKEDLSAVLGSGQLSKQEIRDLLTEYSN